LKISSFNYSKKGSVLPVGDWSSLGKMLVMMGLFIFFLGLILLGLGKLLSIGRLPGDIYYQKGNFTFYFPIVTCIIISLLLTLILNLFNR